MPGRAEHCWHAHMHGWGTQRGSPATAATPRSWIKLWRSGPRVTEIRRSKTTPLWLTPSSKGKRKHTSRQRMKASSVSGLSITRRPVATAFLKVTANDDSTNTIVRTARLLIGFGRAVLSNALAAHLTSPALGLLRRRIAISVHLCWVPLAVLSLAQAHFLRGTKLSFFRMYGSSFAASADPG